MSRFFWSLAVPPSSESQHKKRRKKLLLWLLISILAHYWRKWQSMFPTATLTFQTCFWGIYILLQVFPSKDPCPFPVTNPSYRRTSEWVCVIQVKPKPTWLLIVLLPCYYCNAEPIPDFTERWKAAFPEFKVTSLRRFWKKLRCDLGPAGGFLKTWSKDFILPPFLSLHISLKEAWWGVKDKLLVFLIPFGIGIYVFP